MKGETRGDRPVFHPTSCIGALVRMFKVISLVHETKALKTSTNCTVIRCVDYLRVEILSYFLLNLYWLARRVFSDCNYVCLHVCLFMHVSNSFQFGSAAS